MPVLSEELRAEAERMKERYPQARSAMLPLLYLMQSVEGHVSREGLREVGEILGLTTAEVEAVASFYTMIRLRPTGDWLVSICTNISCALLGGKRLYERATQEVGDGQDAVTLHEEECLGACEQAPVVQVNFLNYAKVDEESLLALIGRLRDGSPPPSTQGGVPADFRTTCRVLAGMPPDARVARG
jgi:NADH-quinone oxidoreductase subunit E